MVGTQGELDGRSQDPSPLVLVFGASNVRRGLVSLIKEVNFCCGSSWDLVVVAGHGRSYGASTSVLGRRLPGIRQAVWRDHFSSHHSARYALLTDFGNDLFYGATIFQIQQWIEECLAILHREKVKLTMTGLPLEAIQSCQKAKFFLLRTIFFPKTELNFCDAIRGAERLDEVIRELAETYRASYVQPSLQWYGVDPIHIRKGCYANAWSAFLRSDEIEKSAEKSREIDDFRFLLDSRWKSLLISIKLFFIRAHQQRWLMIDRSMKQPALRIDARRRVWFY
ncbi:MAG: hypothetical protein RLY14_2191 [Planctomycetota bacterium]